MSKEVDFSILNSIQHNEYIMKSELDSIDNEKDILKFIANRLVDIITELRLINSTKL